MIGSIDIKVNAARPNLPLAPLFAFQDSPSSIRVMDVPKSIGNWAITSVKVAVEYPDNTTVEKVAVRSGSVWVATFDGSEVAGKVLNGYSVIADGKDEDGNDVTGYVLGKGDVFILENDTELSRLVGKIAVRYMDEIPDVPAKGDLMNSNGELRLFDGEDWIVISTTEAPPVYDSQITLQKNGTTVGKFSLNQAEPKTIDMIVPSRTSDLTNDSGFISEASYIEDENGNRIDADRTITSLGSYFWFEHDIKMVGTKTNSTLEDGRFSDSLVFENGNWTFTRYVEGEFYHSQTISGSETDTDVYFSDLQITVHWRQEVFTGTLALESQIPSRTTDIENDSGFITASAIPSKVSSFENDVGYITESAIPSNVGAFQNDVGYLTSVSWGEVQDKPDVALMSDIPSNVSELDNDAGYITANALPTKVSELQNDSGFITASAIPSNLSAFNNDVGYITASAIPSNVGAFTNDVGYLTASDVSTSALYPSATYSAYVQIDDYGEVNAKKLVNETGVWFVKAILEQYTSDPVTGYWVSPPKITDNGTNLLVEFWVQDKERIYEPMNVSHLASSSAIEVLLPVNYHNVNFRVWLKKSTQSDIPLWIDCGRLVRDGDANTGLRISQIEDDIGLIHDISEKRDLTDISYPASVDPTGMYTISQFTVDGVLYDVFGTEYPSTGDSYWTDDGEYHTNCVWTSDGTNYQLRLSDTDFGSTFTFAQLKAGSVEVTSDEVSHTVTATFKQTTFALKDYVDSQIGNVLNEQF